MWRLSKISDLLPASLVLNFLMERGGGQRWKRQLPRNSLPATRTKERCCGCHLRCRGQAWGVGGVNTKHQVPQFELLECSGVALLQMVETVQHSKGHRCEI